MTERPPIFIVGAGRLGSSLARALIAAAWPVAGAYGRTRAPTLPCPTYVGELPLDAIRAAPVVFITTSDAAIAEVGARVLGAHHLALHASGACPAAVLRGPGVPRSVAACHPLQSVASPLTEPDHFRGVSFGIEGEPEAAALAAQLAEALGGHPLHFEGAEAKALYHAACCTVSGGLVALAHRAVDLFEAAGVARPEALRALAPLMLGTAQNLAAAKEPADVLTGPIARGDLAVVASHLAAMDARLPTATAAYRALCEELTRTARAAPNARVRPSS